MDELTQIAPVAVTIVSVFRHEIIDAFRLKSYRIMIGPTDRFGIWVVEKQSAELNAPSIIDSWGASQALVVAICDVRL